MTTIRDYLCSNSACLMKLLDPQPATPASDLPGPDDLLICGACGTTNIVTIFGTQAMTKEEEAALSEEELRDIRFAMRNLKQGRKDN